MPSALRRSLRAPVRVLAGGVLAVALVATAFLQSGASAALKQTVDPGWRGVYDILVTAPDAARSQLLAPNSLSAGNAALKLADVEALRALSGVEVAAPIGHIVASGWNGGGIQLSVPVATEQGGAVVPEAFRATVRLTTDDGLGERLVSENRYAMVLDLSAKSARSESSGSSENDGDVYRGGCAIGDVPIPCSLYEWHHPSGDLVAWVESNRGGSSTSYSVDRSDEPTVDLWLPHDTAADQRVTMVDPVAERELLGEAGAFLDPLVQLGEGGGFSRAELEAWLVGKTGEFPSALGALLQRLAEERADAIQSAPYQEYLRVKAERGEVPNPADYLGPETENVPILVAGTRAVAPVRAEVTVESFGPVPGGAMPDGYGLNLPPILETIRAGEAGVAVGSVIEDASALLDPLSSKAVLLPWPGTQLAAADAPPGFEDVAYLGFNGAVGVANIAPTETRFDADGTPFVQLNGVGFRAAHNANGDASGSYTESMLKADPLAPGSEAVFSLPRKQESSMALSPDAMTGLSVGSFSSADLDAVLHRAGGVPLGAYEPIAATRVETADGEANDATPVTPALGAFGLLGSATTAIADVTGPAWRGEAIVEAVRVRVAGIDAYDAAGVEAVTQTARAIEDLGYTATIVAGSEPEMVQLGIGNYAFGTTDAAGSQRVGELGVVEQTWSKLGAAANAGLDVSAASRLMLGVALLSALALLAVIEFGAVPARRREAAVLRSAGWQRARIVRWFAAEQAPSWLLLAASVTIAGLVAASSSEPGLTATAAGVVLLCASAITLCAIVRASQPPVEAAVGVRQLEHAQGAHRPQIRVNPDAAVNAKAQLSPAARARPARARPARTRVASSPTRWGVRHATRKKTSLLAALAVLAGMSAVGSLFVVFAESAGGAGGSLPGNAQTVIVLLPQIALSVCAGTAGVLLLLLVRNRSAADRAIEDRLLRESGWVAQDRRRAASAGTLVVTLGAVLFGAYALWFVLEGTGVTVPASTVNSAVSAAIVAGVVMAVLFLVPMPISIPLLRKPVARDGTTARAS